ncbi:MAG TPA: ATP-binding protein [Polyangiaceae bacterium]|nr:ATP-binding protein [Polyangiaceae bacterium]
MEIPARVPGLEIGEELGHGTYSVVYRARQGETSCAVKLPRVQGKWTRWVYREAVALARVRHPGLPRVIEVGEADGLPYLLMELVEGESLASRLLLGALPTDQVLDLGCQLADALRSVHEAGLVHRDVKPRNVLLDARNKARLVDFGFVSPIGALAARDAVGTRRYSAPEQFLAPDKVDARADLYALGSVLFECLNGRPSAEADPTRGVVELTASGVPASFARIIGDLLARAPEDRYPDATALLTDLHRVRAKGTPLGARAFEASRSLGPIVGRDADLERFTRAWREVERSGGRVVLVEGIRGSGKTRFLRACSALVREEGRGRSLEAVCREADAPLAALRRAFENYFELLERLAPHERAAVRTALRSAAEGPVASLACVIAPGFADILGLSKPATTAIPDAFAEGAAELLIRLARLTGPLFVAFDDVQWMDAASLDVISAVADRAHEASLLLYLSARPHESGSAFDLFDAVGPRRSTRIAIGPLDLRQSAALIAAHLGVGSADPALVRRVVAAADDTPVGILEVLGAFLDDGALRFRDNAWQLEAANVNRVALPSGALSLLGHRVRELPPATKSVMEVAAILGTQFEDALLADVLGLSVHDIGYALADGRQAGLLVLAEAGHHAFCHDSAREMLVAGLDDASRSKLHQRAAERLAKRADSNVDTLYACAAHFAAGDLRKSPLVAYSIARKAAEAALDRFDNDAALRFFEMARVCAEAASRPLDVAFHRKVGEANLRVGALDQSVRAFETALELAKDPVSRAAILARLVWVRRERAEPDAAWAALEHGFAALGVPMSADEIAPEGLAPRPPMPPGREVLDVLYDLYQHYVRLGLDRRWTLTTLARRAEVVGAALSQADHASVTLARAHLTCHAHLTLCGHSAAGEQHLEAARVMAEKLGDPALLAVYLVRRSVAHAYRGHFDAMLADTRECADKYAPWMETNEFCATVGNGDFTESLRGRAAQAWSWIVRAVDRLRRRRHTSQAVPSYLAYRAQAALAAMGRSGQEGPWLASQLNLVANRPPEKARYGAMRWGPQVRNCLETGSLGAEFEDLVSSFQAEGYHPSDSHPMLAEWYIGVGHARVEQYLRAARDDRPSRIAALVGAAADLRAAAKTPLYKAHSNYVDACLAWFEGRLPKANRLLARAEILARRETCPWVLWGVARVRAHMLRDEGNLDAARDQARIAETLAREHGAEARAQLVRSEFSLPSPVEALKGSSSASSARRSSHRARRQLSSLLHVARAPYGQLRREQQCAAIVDDLVRELAADRAFILFEPPDDVASLLSLGRSRLGETLPAASGWRESFMRAAMQHADPWIAALPDELSPENAPDRKRVLAVPLLLNERVVGSLCVERRTVEAPFDLDDQELLMILAHQVPLGLELSRLLEQRDSLQASFQQAQKMEVVGQLASGVAHDLNNMLNAIAGGIDALRMDGLAPQAVEDMQMIEDGYRRASRLTRKLLSMSRDQPLTLASTDVNALIKGLEPMMKRLVSTQPHVDVVLDLDLRAHPAVTDETSFDQALVNLVINARDAITGRGKITISTRNEVLGADAVRHGAQSEGDYVVIEVSDTGSGIPPEVLRRIYEPFFTTKPAGKGTGLGLTMVYAFVKQCGGYLEVESHVGQGTAFRIYLRRGEPIHLMRRSSGQAKPRAVPGVHKPAMILVVDDDPTIRELTRDQLQEGGYQVVTASGSSEALSLVQSKGAEIALVVLDMNMPEMTGQELGKRLADMNLPAKVLFVTGYAPEQVAEWTGVEPDRMLQKPFRLADLLDRVRNLLDA